MFSSLHHFNSYLKRLLFVYIFGGNFEDQYNTEVVNEVFNSFSNKTRNKILKKLLINSISKDFENTLQNYWDHHDVRFENCKSLEKQIMLLSFRTLIEMSTIPLTKDFRKPQSKIILKIEI